MAINGILNTKTIYFAGLALVIALMPWSTHWCANVITIASVLGIVSTTFHKKFERLKENPSVFLFIGLYLLYVIGIFYTSETSEGWISLEQKLFLIGLPVIVSSSSTLSQNHLRLLLVTFVFSNLALTLFNIGYTGKLWIMDERPLNNFDIYTNANFENSGYANDVWSRFSYISLSNQILDPTYFSFYLVFCIAVLIFSENNLSKRMKWIIGVWFSLFILLLASRMGIFLLDMILILTILFKLELSPSKKVLASIAVVVSMIIAIFLFPVTRFRMIEEPLSTSRQLPSDATQWNSTNLRLMEWESGVSGIQETGIFGTGTGGTWRTLNHFASKQNLGVFSGEFNVHNQYLETMLEIGVAGLIVLMLSYLVPLFHAFKTRNYLLFSLTLIVCFSSLTESILERAHGLIFFTTFASILMYSGSYDTAA